MSEDVIKRLSENSLQSNIHISVKICDKIIYISNHKFMCGGVGFRVKNIPDEELKKYYSPEYIEKIKKTGRGESFFWLRDAVLPIKVNGKTQLKLWGNKDEDVRLPSTGWARVESLEMGKWDYLSPEEVDIIIESGYEKKVWFDMPNGC